MIVMNKIENQSKSSIRQKIPQYINKIEKQQQFYEKQFCKLAEEFLRQASQQIAIYLGKSRQSFQKYRKKLSKELTTLYYYSQHPQQNHNLYPLFSQIDQKWMFNINLIEQSHFNISLPCPNSCDLDQQVLMNKIGIYQNYIAQLQAVLRSDTVRKYCKKELQNGERIVKTYVNLLENAKETVYSSEVKIKHAFEEAMAQLSKYRHVEKLKLCITTVGGILMPSHYHKLLECLRPNRVFLSDFQLKIMDMQFSQQKCDILRKRLNAQFKHIKRLSIQNYYKECKLGLFQDFNWQPYRKKVHVTAGVW